MEKTMKVVEVSEDAQKWVRYCKCGKCKSLLLVVEEDLIRYMFLPSIPADNTDCLIFTCTVCKAINAVPQKQGPEETIRHRLQQAAPGASPPTYVTMCTVVSEEEKVRMNGKKEVSTKEKEWNDDPW
jgi:RNase P subunit RPR2